MRINTTRYQVPKRSKNPLVTSHILRGPIVEIMYMVLPVVKSVWKRQSNKEYETNHSAYGPVIICNRKQGYYTGHRICKMMTLNEIHYIHPTSYHLSVVCLVLRSHHTQCMLLRIDSSGKYTHHNQMKVV
jgi:hypothetical protein